MQDPEQIMGIIVMPIFFGMIALIFKMYMDWKKVRLKSDLHHKLVEKFGNVSELNNFLQSDTGNHFLKSLTIDGLAPKEKLISAVSRGIITCFLGVAILLLGWAFAEESRYFIGSGITVVVLGIGLLAAAAVSFYLSKKWGIIEPEAQ